MKAKVVLGLAVCCLLSALLGSMITGQLGAQHTVSPYPITLEVRIEGDPLRGHALQAESWYVEVPTGGLIKVFDPLPENKMFMLTDIKTGGSVNVYADENCTIKKTTGGTLWDFFITGIAFKPGEGLWLIGSSGTKVTLSGYWVDL